MPRTILITGAGSGFGRGAAIGMARNGHRIIASVHVASQVTPLREEACLTPEPTLREIFAEGPTVIVLFDASGTARDGKPYANTYAWFLDMQDGRIVNASAFFDSIAFNDFWQRLRPETAQD
jgi:ketosteroid isomerase-like protein